MEALPGLWSLTPLGGMIGVIVVFYLLLATGKIITKGSHERELAMANQRGDDWKETSGMKDTTIAAQAKQIGDLIEANKINQTVFLHGKSIAETSGA